MPTVMITWVALGLATAAAYMDVRAGLIPNRLTFPAILAGFAMNGAATGWGGIVASAQGFGVGIALLLVPFVFLRLGAGDLKLLAGLGAFVGPEGVLWTFIIAATLGAVIGLFLLLRAGYWRRVPLLWLAPRMFLAESQSSSLSFPFAAPILLGLLGTFFVA